MALMRFDPFRELDRFAEQVMAGSRVPQTMPMEAFRRGDQFLVYIDLPGVDRKDVDLTVERNVISVRAERLSPRQESDELIVDERPQGIFTRQLFLGNNLDAGSLTADLDRGVLTLTIPIAEVSKPRRIELGEQPRELERNDSSTAEQPQDLQSDGSSITEQGSNPQPATTS
jgi:HSP20 family protein